MTYMVGALLCLLGCVWIYLGEGPTYQSRDVYFVAILLGEKLIIFCRETHIIAFLLTSDS